MNKEQKEVLKELSIKIDEANKDNFIKMYNSILDRLHQNSNNEIGKSRITILYHNDMDGCISAYCTLAAIKNIVYNDYYKKCNEQLKNYTVDTLPCCVDMYSAYNYPYHEYIRFKRINYNYDISKLFVGDEDMIFLVDYSLSNKDHKKYLLENTKADIYWLDHHESSLDIINNEDPNSLDYKFMHNPRVFNAFFTERGASAALLCYRFLMTCSYMSTLSNSGINDYIKKYYNTWHNNELMKFLTDGQQYKTPDLIGYTSLYDTFHPLSDRRFSYISRIVDIDIENLIARDSNNFTKEIDYMITEDKEFDYNMMIKMFAIEIGVTRSLAYKNNLRSLDSVLEIADYILDYDINSHNIIKRSQEIEFALNLYGETYSMVAINTMGNSFVFEESYYNHDAVMVFYFNNKGTYTYSIYSCLDNNHPLNCAEVAKLYGGGGHKGAAGFTYSSNILEDIIKNNNIWNIE